MAIHSFIDPHPINNLQSDCRVSIQKAHRCNEIDAVQMLLNQLIPFDYSPIEKLARRIILSVREEAINQFGVTSLMQTFSLSSEEGIALMCLAEALLRIPDKKTVDELINDKIAGGNWLKHANASSSLFMNAAVWGLFVTGKMISPPSEDGLLAALSTLLTKGSEPLIRKAIECVIRLLGNQFVTGETIEAAIKNSQANEAKGYTYSYDMLGEAALTQEDADVYWASYEAAIHAIGKLSGKKGIKKGPGISVKLSALHPRYCRAQQASVMSVLLPQLKKLVYLAQHYNIGFNIDAEEADRLDLSLDLIKALIEDPAIRTYEGLGIVVQAYQKRCPFVIDFLVDLARKHQQKIMIRLVKGAYWDSEIKRAQVEGLIDYPVYTRKVYTDLSYLVCAQKLLAAMDVVYPQFATHNALTLAAIYTWAEEKGEGDYEFQCLYGMGEILYSHVVGKDKLNRPCRIYAPVGSHQTLLAYLVRRLLENGANSSFVNQLVDKTVSIEKLVENPVALAKKLTGLPHPGIDLPSRLFGQSRKNSTGLDFSNDFVLHELQEKINPFGLKIWHAEPLLSSSNHTSYNAQTKTDIHNPARLDDWVGDVVEVDEKTVQIALEMAHSYQTIWENRPIQEKAAMLNKAADLLENNQYELLAILIREAGKTFSNAMSELREAVDFLRYYAAQSLLDKETKKSALGIVVCISPWNFPLAIYLGQISAALIAGNVVIAKPSEQTPLVAYRATQLLHEAGIPFSALQFLPGKGELVGAALVQNSQVKGVIFTGSTEVARLIDKTITKRIAIEKNDIVLIAETGGQNALIVDSSALLEQVIQDVLTSAFDSAGQRCSALRVLCLQEDIFDKAMNMLHGAMNTLQISDPALLSTDVGPVIDKTAYNHLLNYIQKRQQNGWDVYQTPLPDSCSQGFFIPPTIIRIAHLHELEKEVFGPVLHVLSYKQNTLPELVEQINHMGYGLTLGVHSRINKTIAFVIEQAKVGNIYVNRNMVGAVVGVQPFGGEGKSGTGPKAGGPFYLKRLQHERNNKQVNDMSTLEASIGKLVSLEETILPLARHVDNTRIVSSAQVLEKWIEKQPLHTLYDLGKEYIKKSPAYKTWMLKGPTGEQNIFRLVPRGNIFCAAITINALLNQLFAVLATHNRAIVLKDTYALIPKDLLVVVDRFIYCVEYEAIHTQCALIEAGMDVTLRERLHSHSEAIITTITTINTEPIALWPLLVERTVSINTAAAGGNTTLVTLID